MLARSLSPRWFSVQQALVHRERELDETITATFDFLHLYGSGKTSGVCPRDLEDWGLHSKCAPSTSRISGPKSSRSLGVFAAVRQRGRNPQGSACL